MNWTCCICEHQVDERFYDTEERMCDDCFISEDEEDDVDKLELWVGTIVYYLEKIAPFMIAGLIIHLIINLWRLYA